MRVLVTGCSGFIGSHVAEILLASGHEVVGIDNLSSGVDYTPAGVEFHQIDLNVWVGGLPKYDAVVHCAAYPELRHNWDAFEQRERLYNSNIAATINLLETMPDDVPIIFLSTASVYGSDWDPERHNLNEEDFATHIESPYAASKAAGEALVQAYSHKARRNWYILRLVNVVGARGHRGVIRDFVRMAREGHIHAADNGKQRKSWVHVRDVAGAISAILAAYEVPNIEENNSVPNGIYNVTSTERISWWDIIDAMGIPRDQVTYERRKIGAVGDPHCLSLSGSKLAPWYVATRSIHQGIEEALKSLQWEMPASFDDFAEPDEPAVP